MIDYKQLGLDDVLFDDEDNLVESTKDGYVLLQYLSDDGKSFEYNVVDPFNVLISKWTSDKDALNMSKNEYNNSMIKKIFKRSVALDKEGNLPDVDAINNKNFKAPKNDVAKKSYYSFLDNDSYTSNYKPSTYSNYSSSFSRKTGYVDKLNKSNTLVVHLNDPSTVMLKQIYDGKGWDVLTDSYIDKDEMHKLLEMHERVVCLGHGTSYGLMGGNIGPEEAPYLKDKKLFVIWCNADRYFLNHNIGHGQMITKNVPSEVGEAAAIGARVTADWMLENITYWSKCMADVIEIGWGNPHKAVEIARTEYQKSKTPNSTPDEIKVIDYNTDAIQVLP